MKPRGILMMEHRLIESMLQLVEKELAASSSAGSIDDYFVISLIDFIKTYADRTHHGKEEDILFERLRAKPLGQQHLILLDELIMEHNEARIQTAALSQAAAAFKAGAEEQLPVIRQSLRFLTSFYPRHIAKEDKFFFPETEKYFSPAELADIVTDFHQFDRQMIHEKYHKLYETLRAGLDQEA